jgi:hypothetical protein
MGELGLTACGHSAGQSVAWWFSPHAVTGGYRREIYRLEGTQPVTSGKQPQLDADFQTAR